MPYVKKKMGALIMLDPAAARVQMMDAYQAAGCSKRDASIILGCNEHTFQNWTKKLGIEKDLETMRKRAVKEGWYHGRHGGKKPKSCPK